MKVTLVKLSICPCGYFAVSESVPIGVEYEILDSEGVQPCTWICGGCGREQQIEGVFVVARGPSEGGWMPAELFSNHPSNQTTEPKTP